MQLSLFKRISAVRGHRELIPDIFSRVLSCPSRINRVRRFRFAVFALGSSAYPNFCAFGKHIDELLLHLGGERILKVATGDEMCAQEQAFSAWSQEVFKVSRVLFRSGFGFDFRLSCSWRVKLFASTKITPVSSPPSPSNRPPFGLSNPRRTLSRMP